MHTQTQNFTQTLPKHHASQEDYPQEGPQGRRRQIPQGHQDHQETKKADKADKPKRAPGPYMLFCKAQRPKIVAKNPKFTFGEVGKELGAQWKKLSDAEKKKYAAK